MPCFLLAACAGREVEIPAATAGTVVVHNAIHIGLIETTFFVVDSVDGTKVHEKLDFKRQVEIAAGKHELRVAYYTDALWGSREGSEACTVVVQAEPNGIYNLQGEAERGEWRARLINRRTSQELPCLFDDEIAPVVTEVDETLQVERAAPLAVAVPVGASETKPTIAVAPADSAAGDADAKQTGVAEPPNRAPRRRSFCPSGFYRVAYLDGDTTFVLERSDRVRLIGVQADPTRTSLPERDEAHIEGKCVRFDYEPTNLIDGHRDRDGRLLAYVYLEDGTFVNLELIRQGGFRATSERHKHLASFLAAQAEARDR